MGDTTDLLDLELKRDVGQEKGEPQKPGIFTNLIFTSLSFILLDSDKDVCMDSNQVYNVIRIDRKNPTRGVCDQNSILI